MHRSEVVLRIARHRLSSVHALQSNRKLAINKRTITSEFHQIQENILLTRYYVQTERDLGELTASVCSSSDAR